MLCTAGTGHGTCNLMGERLAVALVLNRADWLKASGYTIAEALDRIGTTWAELIPEAARTLRAEMENGGESPDF